MLVKVGINGFGRIARVILRILEERDTDIEVCAINLRNADIKRMAYQMEYDSVFGRFRGRVRATDTELVINGKKIKVFSEEELAEAGANIIIHANHLTRAAYVAMRDVAQRILECHRSLEADDMILPIKEVLTLIPKE